MRRSMILNVLALACSTLSIFIFIDLQRPPYTPIWIMTTGLVVGITFLRNNYWTFRDLSGPSEGAGPGSAYGSL